MLRRTGDQSQLTRSYFFYGLHYPFTNQPIRSHTLASTYSATVFFLAGMAGLEPASEGVKVPCLTTWLHPYMEIPIGFEPMILGLQPRALPLGYGIIN